MPPKSKADVPPGSSSNPPQVRAKLRQACDQIDDIEKRLEALRKTLHGIDCGKPPKKQY